MPSQPGVSELAYCLVSTIEALFIYLIIHVVFEVQKENTTIIPNKHTKLQIEKYIT